ATHAPRNASVTSAREARFTTKPPRQTTKKLKNAKSPHCPGETHAAPRLSRIMDTIPKLVGLKMCLLFQRRRNLLATAPVAVAAARRSELVLNAFYPPSLRQETPFEVGVS